MCAICLCHVCLVGSGGLLVGTCHRGCLVFFVLVCCLLVVQLALYELVCDGIVLFCRVGFVFGILHLFWLCL